MWELPTTISLNNKKFNIRTDYRAILDILIALDDPNYEGDEKVLILIQILYEDWEDIEDYEDAYIKGMEFINMGTLDKSNTGNIKLMDWEQDSDLIIAPINQIVGTEIRSLEYMHWYTFLSAYMNIGESIFSEVVAIRDKMKKGKQLDKDEKEFYKRNAEMIKLKPKLSNKEKEFFKNW